MLLTAGEIEAIAEEIKIDFAGRNVAIDKTRLARRMTTEPQVPEAYKDNIPQTVHLPLVRDFIRRSVAALTATKARVRVPPWSAAPDAQKNASNREKVTSAAMRLLEKESGEQLLVRATDDVISKGIAVMKLVMAQQHWSGFPKRKDGEDPDLYIDRTTQFKQGKRLPFVWRRIPVETFFAIPGDGGILRALEISERPLWVVRDTFGIPENELKKVGGSVPYAEFQSPYNTDKVTVIETWDKHHAQWVVDGRLVHKITHNYGRVPYFVAEAPEIDDDMVKYTNEPVVWPLVMLQEILEQLETMKLNVCYLYGYPKLALETPEEGMLDISPATGGPAPVEWKTGNNLLVLHPGQKITQPFVARTGPDIQEMIAELQGWADRAGLGPLMSGMGAGSDWSGYMTAILVSAARAQFDPIVSSMTTALEDMTSFFWWLIENKLKDSIIVAEGKRGNWLELKPEEIKGYYRNEWIIKPYLPQNTVAMGQWAAAMTQNKLMTRRRAMEEHLDIEQPDEEKTEIWLEEIEEDPMVKQFALEQAFPEVVQAIEEKKQQEMMATQGPAPTMGAPTPGMGIPMGPEEVAAGQATSPMPPGRPAGTARLPGGTPQLPTAT